MTKENNVAVQRGPLVRSAELDDDLEEIEYALLFLAVCVCVCVSESLCLWVCVRSWAGVVGFSLRSCRQGFFGYLGI